jgi:Ca2+:H+ antiporter
MSNLHFKALVIPAAYHNTQAKPEGSRGDSTLVFSINNRHSDLDPDAEAGLLVISRGTAVLLLGVYVIYLFFQVSTG